MWAALVKKSLSREYGFSKIKILLKNHIIIPKEWNNKDNQCLDVSWRPCFKNSKKFFYYS